MRHLGPWTTSPRKITGGLGRDTLTGGEGRDRFEFSSIFDISKLGANDVSTDFAKGDVIDLSCIDANTLRRGDQDFKFIGDSGFSGRAGELNYVVVGANVIVQGDVNGDKTSDFQLELTGAGTLALQKWDFIL